MDALTIGQVAQHAGVAPSTIRYYERIALLPQPRRVSGQRRYDAAVIERLLFIQTTQRLGFTLSEIQQLFQHHETAFPLPVLWQTLAQQKLSDVERMIQHATTVQQLLLQGLRCGCATMADCMSCVGEQCGALPC